LKVKVNIGQTAFRVSGPVSGQNRNSLSTSDSARFAPFRCAGARVRGSMAQDNENRDHFEGEGETALATAVRTSLITSRPGLRGP
jgi:hypothetical protein